MECHYLFNIAICALSYGVEIFIPSLCHSKLYCFYLQMQSTLLLIKCLKVDFPLSSFMFPICFSQRLRRPGISEMLGIKLTALEFNATNVSLDTVHLFCRCDRGAFSSVVLYS